MSRHHVQGEVRDDAVMPTPKEEAIARVRAQREDYKAATDEQIGKLAQTQWVALGISVERLKTAIRAQFRRRG